MSFAILLLCSSFAFAQSTSSAPETKTQLPANSSDQKSDNYTSGKRTGVHGRQLGNLEILSDTRGVDFGPYLQRVVEDVRSNWYHLISRCVEMKKGKLAIDFAIMKDGRVQGLTVRASSGDPALDRPAYGSITSSDPFLALPIEFTGPYLKLRFRFYYNPDKSDLDSDNWDLSKPVTADPNSSSRDCRDIDIDLHESHTKTKSGIAVSISAPLNAEVPLGGSIPITAMVTGTGAQENTVEWSLSGLGCSGTGCGEQTKDSYHAPTVMPNPPYITLTATSKADPTAKGSVTLHIVEQAPPR